MRIVGIKCEKCRKELCHQVTNNEVTERVLLDEYNIQMLKHSKECNGKVVFFETED